MDRFEEHLELHRLDCISSHRLLDHYNFTARASGPPTAPMPEWPAESRLRTKSPPHEVTVGRALSARAGLFSPATGAGPR